MGQRPRRIGLRRLAQLSSNSHVCRVKVKKIYMNEWTGQEDEAALVSILEVLRAAIPGWLEELGSG